MKRRLEKALLEMNPSYVGDGEDALRPTRFGPTSLHPPAATEGPKKNTRGQRDRTGEGIEDIL